MSSRGFNCHDSSQSEHAGRRKRVECKEKSRLTWHLIIGNYYFDDGSWEFLLKRFNEPLRGIEVFRSSYEQTKDWDERASLTIKAGALVSTRKPFEIKEILQIAHNSIGANLSDYDEKASTSKHTMLNKIMLHEFSAEKKNLNANKLKACSRKRSQISASSN